MKNHRTEPPEPGIPAAGWTLPEPVTVGNGRTEVHLQLVAQGRDFLVLITGGQAHVGAIAVCNGRSGPDHGRDNEGLLQLPGHREGPLAAEAAEILALASGRTCAAVVGIHQDQATPAEIRDIGVHVRQGLDQLTAEFNRGEKS